MEEFADPNQNREYNRAEMTEETEEELIKKAIQGLGIANPDIEAMWSFPIPRPQEQSELD